ncbi:hypothetical protein EV128_12357 [Rhizobium azibense]|nr:hypothetical protein EV128_12357 [Rhizobium azibense]
MVGLDTRQPQRIDERQTLSSSARDNRMSFSGAGLTPLECDVRLPTEDFHAYSYTAEQWVFTVLAAEQTPWWAWVSPAVAWAILLVTPFTGSAGLVVAAAGVALIATVFAAVFHAEVVAQRVGEPFGTLVLAIAVTVPKAVVGIVIAGVVLLPECLAALKAAQANRLQTSLNLALGSPLRQSA